MYFRKLLIGFVKRKTQKTWCRFDSIWFIYESLNFKMKLKLYCTPESSPEIVLWRQLHHCMVYDFVVSIIQTYRPWTPRRTSGRIVNKKIGCKGEAYQNFGKRFDWSFAIKRHIVMAAPIVETIWLVNGFKRHIVMAVPLAVTVPSSVQNLMNSLSRRFDGKSRSLDDLD